MSVESDDDRLALLADFGVTATISGNSVVGILDNQFEDVNGVMVQTPVFTARTIDVSSYARATAITIESVAYTIAEHQVDGLGLTHIILQKT